MDEARAGSDTETRQWALNRCTTFQMDQGCGSTILKHRRRYTTSELGTVLELSIHLHAIEWQETSHYAEMVDLPLGSVLLPQHKGLGLVIQPSLA